MTLIVFLCEDNCIQPLIMIEHYLTCRGSLQCVLFKCYFNKKWATHHVILIWIVMRFVSIYVQSMYCRCDLLDLVSCICEGKNGMKDKANYIVEIARMF